MIGPACTSAAMRLGTAPTARLSQPTPGPSFVNPGFRQNPNGFLGVARSVSISRPATGSGDWKSNFGNRPAQDHDRRNAHRSSRYPNVRRVDRLDCESDRAIGYAWDRWMLYGKGGAATMQEPIVWPLPAWWWPPLPITTPRSPALAGLSARVSKTPFWITGPGRPNKLCVDANDSISNPFSVNTFGAAASRTDMNIHAVKAGINYRFGGPAPATGTRQQPALQSGAGRSGLRLDWTVYVACACRLGRRPSENSKPLIPRAETSSHQASPRMPPASLAADRSVSIGRQAAGSWDWKPTLPALDCAPAVQS